MKTKSKISGQLRKKSNPELVKTITTAKKKEKWSVVAGILSGPKRNMMNLNLSEINNLVKEDESIVVPGKVLSQGEINKKGKLIAFGFSRRAKEKLKEAGIDFDTIINEIKKNPEARGIKIINGKK
ncbi:50S ribosomal protein L18e [Candidatus Pacearchaeota archaeon]|nr:50S ribosomal protein L18e [Candidatus Pacearchaeota archaeon]|tara:strand:+ start:1974 stop:2351 length:378 start_codon:yes stop_codon:yes gene_type:complete